LLNGWVNYETWVPSDKMLLPETKAFLAKYQAKAGAAGVDPLGYYLGTWGYAYIQVYGDAITATKSLDDGKLADYMHKTTFKTINGNIKFGPGGEWEKSGMLQVQYHGIKQGAGLDMSGAACLTRPC
jgi:branched-chain amino acid transport system substrate-binding protein